jgi:RND family efflux transporter MFP subunit
LAEANAKVKSAPKATSSATPVMGWLALHCRAISGTTHGLVLLDQEGPAQEPVCVAQWPPGEAGSRTVMDAARTAVRLRRVVIREHAGGAEAQRGSAEIAVPVRHGNRCIGAVAIRVGHVPGEGGTHTAKARVDILESGVSWLASLAGDAAAKSRLTSALEVLATAVEQASFRSAATAVTTELATRLGCERVSLGVLRRRQMRVEALSHSTSFDARTNLISDLGAAMDEAADQDSTISHPDPRDARVRIALAHEQLVRRSSVGAAWTVPLASRGEIVGALTFERPEQKGVDAETIAFCEDVAALVGPVLILRHEVETPWHERLRAGVRHRASLLIRPGHPHAKLAAIVALAVLGFLAVARGELRISADARLEGRVQRAIVAGIDGYIAEATSRAGDTVRKGQLMGRLDDRDVILKKRNWEGREAQLIREYREAIAQHDRSQVTILSSQLQQTRAELQLVATELARTQLVAPFDGIVVQGDLSQTLGSPVERGAVLFEIAPLDGYRIILEVDERDISHLARGQSGRLALTALPGDPLSLTVSRILPVSVATDGHNYFRVEAQLDAGPQGLRPGMEGVAKIDAGRNRYIWIWTRGLLDWLRLRTWSWLP